MTLLSQIFTDSKVVETPRKINFNLDDVLDNLHQSLGKRNFPIASSAWIEKVPRQVSPIGRERAVYFVEENAIWLKWEKYWKSKFSMVPCLTVNTAIA